MSRSEGVVPEGQVLLLRVVSVVPFVAAQRRRGAPRVGAEPQRHSQRDTHTTQARSEAGTASDWLENGLLFGLMRGCDPQPWLCAGFARFKTFWLLIAANWGLSAQQIHVKLSLVQW